MKKTCIAAILISLLFQVGFSQSYCNGKEYRQLDFLLGEWNVYANGELVGESSFTMLLGRCAIQENYTTKGGYEMFSYNTYNKSTNQWEQTRLDNGGNRHQFSGLFNEEKILYKGKGLDILGNESHYRLSFQKNEDKTITHRWEASPDLVKWVTIFEGNYKRKPRPIKKKIDKEELKTKEESKDKS